MKSILTLSHYVRVLLTVVGLMASVISLALSNNAAAAGVA
jgi:general stress protein CsbA